MKALFLIFHGFSEANGISKKIHYQVNAFKECGVDMRLCYLTDKNDQKVRWIDNEILQDYGNGYKGKILKRIEFNSINRYAIENHIDFIYMRFDHNANPFTFYMAWRMKRAGIKVVMEIPTYPYDQEYSRTSTKIRMLGDKLWRKPLAGQLFRIITFSDYDKIFGIPTIQISNGIDFRQIPLKTSINDTADEIHLIGVAEIHYWHGFDRLVRGLDIYYRNEPKYKVYFHIVGDFFGRKEKDAILPLLEANEILRQYIILHGAKYGKELDDLFEQSDMAIGSLARHRSGITKIKTLKNREYAARGLSFTYSENDSDFDERPYIMKVPANEDPINVEEIIRFYKQQKYTPQEIRNSISSLSWKEQMSKVLTIMGYESKS